MGIIYEIATVARQSSRGKICCLDLPHMLTPLLLRRKASRFGLYGIEGVDLLLLLWEVEGHSLLDMDLDLGS